MRVPPRIPLVAIPLALPAIACQTPSTPVRGPVSEGTRAFSVASAWADSVPEDARDIQMGAGRFGYAHRFRDGFALVGELDLSHYDVPGGDDATGIGASGFLRWHAIRGPSWSAFLEYGVGLLATEDEFPPGGTGLNGQRQAGAGLLIELSQALRLTMGVRQQHVSNGRGLTEDNPSWDGLGGYVGLVFDLLPIGHEPVPARVFEPVEPWDWSLGIEGRGGELGSESAGGGVLTFDGRLHESTFGQVRGALDSVDGEALSELGLAVYQRLDQGLFGVAFDRQELDVFHDGEITLFGELYANDLVTAVGVLGHENRSHSPDRVLGAVLLRVYPFDSLMIETGVAARDTYADFDAGSFDVPLGIEYGLPVPESAGLSIFAQDGINDDARIVGVRLRLGSGGPFHPLVDRHRAAGPLRNRP